MQGREHVYWALMAFSIFIFAFSIQQGYYDAGNFTWFALIATISGSMIFNELANNVSAKKKEMDALKKKKSKDEIPDNNDRLEKSVKSATNLLETGLRIITYVTLGLVIVVCVYVGIKGADHAYFIVFSYLCAAFGSIFPDFLDSTIPGDMRFHRDPWTHSSVFVNAIVAGCLLTVEYDYVSLNIFAIAFVLGNTAHLLCDNVESGSTLAEAIRNPVHWKECPGDIRKIREDRERAWLNMHAVMSFIVIGFLALRYGMTSAIDGIMSDIVIYDALTQTFIFSYISNIFILILALFYAFSFSSFKIWSKEKKKEITKKKSVKIMKKKK